MSNKRITQVNKMDGDKCYGSDEVEQGKGCLECSCGGQVAY